MESLELFNEYLRKILYSIALVIAFLGIITIMLLFVSGLIYLFISFILDKIDERKEFKKLKIDKQQQSNFRDEKLNDEKERDLKDETI